MKKKKKKKKKNKKKKKKKKKKLSLTTDQIFVSVLAETQLFFYALYNFHPLKPHFYIVKLGFTGIYIIFLISARQGGSYEYPQSMF